MDINSKPEYELELIKGSYINHGYLLCSISYSNQFANISPIAYQCNNTFYQLSDKSPIRYGASFKENRYDDENIYQPLNDRFYDHELFLLRKFQDNYNNANLEPFFAYGNETEAIDQEAFEIYTGEFTINDDYFIPRDKEIFNLLHYKYEKGARHFFYILTNNDVFGPFVINGINDNQIKLAPVHSNNNLIYKWNYNNIKSTSISFYTDNSTQENALERIVVDGWISAEESNEEIMFLSDDQLLGWLRNKVNVNNKYSKSDLTIFREIFLEFQSAKVEANERNLFERSLKILNESVENKDVSEEFISKIPETKALLNELDEIRNSIDSYKDDKNRIESEIEQINVDLNEKEKKKNDLKDEIQELDEKLKEISEKQINQVQEENEELKLYLSKQEDLRKEIEEIKKYKNLRSLENEISEKNSVIKYLEKNKEELEDSIKTLSQEFIDTQKSSQEKLRELVKSKTHFDFISGRDFSNNDNSPQTDISQIELESFMKKDLENTQFVSYEKLLINETSRYLKTVGRDYKIEFVANLLISIFQNTSTIFAGLPGTGKTSLARILSKIFIKDERKRVEVSVSKGWTSPKDLIGFYNPLSKVFIPSNKKLFNMLSLVDHEIDDNKYFDSNMGFIILDEANLSPIEHYWSCFYNLTDTVANDQTFLAINIGTEKELRNANNIRFIGTINIDQTTEDLSPRFLDRSNVIRIPTSSNFSEIDNSDYIKKISPIDFTYSDAIKLFNLPDFSNDKAGRETYEKESYINIKKEYLKIKERLKELNILISPRIDNAFTKYFLTAEKFMTPYKALDYFIAQRLLTKIDGQGISYGETLKLLKNDLEIIFSGQRIESESIQLIDLIINKGSRDDFFHTYNYFLIN